MAETKKPQLFVPPSGKGGTGASAPRNLQDKPRGMTYKKRMREFRSSPYDNWNVDPPVKQLVAESYLMSRYDCTCAPVIKLIKLMIAGHAGQYKHADPEITAFVNDMIAHIEGGPRMLFNGLLGCLWAGFSVAEKIWALDSKRWVVKNVNVLHPFTFFDPNGRNEGIQLDSTTGSVSKLVQYGGFGDVPVEFDVVNVLYWPFGQESREEVYGQRLTDAARRSWYFQCKLERLWGIYAESFAMPKPIITVPEGQGIPNEFIEGQGRPMRADEYTQKMLDSMGAGDTFVMQVPNGAAKDFTIQNTDTLKGSGETFERLCQYHIAEKFKSMLTSPLLLTEPLHGSRAMSKTATDTFLDLVEGIEAEMAEVLVNQLVAPVLWYNFGPQADFGSWEFAPISTDDLDLLSSALLRISQATGGRFPSEQDDAAIRQKYGAVGLLSEEDLQDADEHEAATQAVQQRRQTGGQPIPGERQGDMMPAGEE